MHFHCFESRENIVNIGWISIMRYNVKNRFNLWQPPSVPPPDSVLCSGRIHSWSAPISMTMTATSPTAPSAVEAGKCSCAATTTAVGQYNTVYRHRQVFGDWQAAVLSFLWPEQGFGFHINRNNLPINVKHDLWLILLVTGSANSCGADLFMWI